MNTSPNFAPPFGERTCLIAWMILMMANTVMIGLSLELVMFGGFMSLYHVNLIGSGTMPFLTIGFFAVLNFPLVAKLHDLGVNHLHFQIHENMMGKVSESWETLILTRLVKCRSNHANWKSWFRPSTTLLLPSKGRSAALRPRPG